jgi:two-component system, sensor histidine kinase and response regulator
MTVFPPKPFATGEATQAAAEGDAPASVVLVRDRIEEIRQIERAAGRDDIFSGFVLTLERSVAGFGAAFSQHIARGDATAAERAAHTLKGTCHQLGAQALGDLFGEVERSAKAGDFAEAQRTYEGGAALIAQSIEALKHA